MSAQSMGVIGYDVVFVAETRFGLPEVTRRFPTKVFYIEDAEEFLHDQGLSETYTIAGVTAVLG